MDNYTKNLAFQEPLLFTIHTGANLQCFSIQVVTTKCLYIQNLLKRQLKNASQTLDKQVT